HRPTAPPPANATANIGQRSDRNILSQPPLRKHNGRSVTNRLRPDCSSAIETECFRCRGHYLSYASGPLKIDSRSGQIAAAREGCRKPRLVDSLLVGVIKMVQDSHCRVQ